MAAGHERGSSFDEGARLLAMLPELYRESPGALDALVGVAADLVAAAREDLARVESQLGASLRGRRLPGATPPPAAGGTLLALRAWWRASGRSIPPPLGVWHGWRVDVLEEERLLEARRAASRAAVVVWDERRLPSPPPDVSVPRQMLPVGVELQAVRLKNDSWRERVPSGARLPGELLWTSRTRTE